MIINTIYKICGLKNLVEQTTNHIVYAVGCGLMVLSKRRMMIIRRISANYRLPFSHGK